MEVPVLFENTDLLVVNKPQGLMVHADGRSEGQTLVDWLLAHDPSCATVGEHWVNPQGKQIPRPGIVHRLDRETSGVMVIAKTESMFVWLKEQFQQRTIKKEYRAFVHGVIQEKEGKVDRAIGRSASDFRKYSAQRGAKGMLRDAVTRYTILSRITENTANWDEWNPQGYSYIALHPETGRTHQLRVHMKSIHHPVVADELYGGSLGKGLGFSRLALHAFRLTVPLPDGSTASFEAPLREDFIKVIEKSA